VRCSSRFRRLRLLTSSWSLICALAWAISTQAEEGFEQQCQNSLPQPFIEIEIRTAGPTVLHERPLAEMTDTGADVAVAPQAAYSRTDLGWTGRVGLNGFKSEDGTVCARASFRIELALSTEVVIAREVFERPCLAELVLGHELEHISISESNLRASADQLEQELGEAYASRRLVGRESGLLQDLNRDVEERWKPRLWALIDEGDVRHRALDARDKAKTFSACGGGLARLLGRQHGIRKQ
jgi:hypothetical protein